jgi:hypothetical protein
MISFDLYRSDSPQLAAVFSFPLNEACPRAGGKRESRYCYLIWTPAAVYPREGGDGCDGRDDSSDTS